MTLRFREFVRTTAFRLTEDEAAPAMGSAPSAPTDPQKTNNAHHFDMLKGQLGMEDDDFDNAMETQSVTLWLPQDYSKKWGFEVAGSTQATVKKRSDGNYDVTFQLKEKKLMLPKSFILPYKKGESPINYEGDVDEKTVVMTAEELQNAMTTPFQAGNFQPPSGGMGGPGGGMGAPQGGPMGGPPGGGAPPPIGGM